MNWFKVARGSVARLCSPNCRVCEWGERACVPTVEIRGRWCIRTSLAQAGGRGLPDTPVPYCCVLEREMCVCWSGGRNTRAHSWLHRISPSQAHQPSPWDHSPLLYLYQPPENKMPPNACPWERSVLAAAPNVVWWLIFCPQMSQCAPKSACVATALKKCLRCRWVLNSKMTLCVGGVCTKMSRGVEF
jgi:hypothetical protein